MGDLLDGETDVALDRLGVVDDTDLPLRIRDVRARQLPPDEAAQDAVQLVEALGRGRGVVDTGGEGPLGDVDELADAKGDVLAHLPLRGEPDMAVEGVTGGLVELRDAPDAEHVLALGEELPDRAIDRHHGVVFTSDLTRAG